MVFFLPLGSRGKWVGVRSLSSQRDVSDLVLVGSAHCGSCEFVDKPALVSIFVRSVRWTTFKFVGGLFLYLCWGMNRLQKDLRGRFLIGWKKVLCKFMFLFQLDACVEPTRKVRCFIHFVITHRSDIWLFFFNGNICSLGFLPECFDLFICFAGEWVWIVLVNQKRFLLKLSIIIAFPVTPE